MAKRLNGVREVVCVVAGTPEPSEKDDAKRSRVQLIGTSGRDLDSGDILSALRHHGIDAVGWWVGHDVITGGIALSARRAMDLGQVALIHHMAYGQYAGNKHGSGAVGAHRHDEQRKLFVQADRCFAVGPKLRDNADDMLAEEDRRPSIMLIPGLAEGIREREPAKTTFRAMVFGRMDAEDDRIKQGSLAVAGMAQACEVTAGHAGSASILAKSRPEIQVVGIEEAGSQTEKDLVALAEQHAGGSRLQVVARPFMENRDSLFRDLSSAHVALMPSWHEGFGLTGWEAIAAGVPVIVSLDSGLHQLLREGLPGAGPGCVSGIQVAGHTPTGPKDPNQNPFQDADVQRVRDAILNIAADPGEYRKRAKTLRDLLLQKGMTWDGAARKFLAELGLNDFPSGDAVPAPKPVENDMSERPGSSRQASSAAWATDPRQTLTPERSALDSLLLRPEYCIVPFQDVLVPLAEDIFAWAESREERGGLSVALRLYSAEGGCGKTRLMVEVCGRLLDHVGARWTAAFVPERTSSAITDIAAMVKSHSRVFLVVDNAESRRPEIVSIIKAALAAPAGHRVRLVLLGRGDGEWWGRLCDDTEDPVARAFLRSLDAVQGPLQLPRPDTGDVAIREQLYWEAQKAFRDRLTGCRPLPSAPAPMPDLSAPHFRHILFLHLAALMALLGRSLETEASLLDTVLDWERDYWRMSLNNSGLDPALLPALEQGLGLLTLTGGAARAQDARDLLRLIPAYRDAGSAREQLFDHLRTLYPLEGGIDSLRPDLLGERLVERVFDRHDELLDCVLDSKDHPGWIIPTLKVLTRIGQKSSPRLLRRALAPSRLSLQKVKQAMEVAIEFGDPLGAELAAAVERTDNKQKNKIASHIWFQLPKKSDALASYIKVITNIISEKNLSQNLQTPLEFCNFLEESANISVSYFSISEFNLAEEWSERAFRKFNDAKKSFQIAATPALPHLYSAYANAMAQQGKTQKALVFFQRSEELWRDLAAKDYEAQQGWAASLNNLGNCLATEGRHAEALDNVMRAEKIWSELASFHPSVHRGDWAISLNNLGLRLGDEGRRDEALQAAQLSEAISRDLAIQHPDAHRPYWAKSLGNLSNCIAQVGRYIEALEAAQRTESVWRVLATQRPNAYRPDWAASLLNLGNHLADAGSYEDAFSAAQLAEEVLRGLTPERPDAYRRDWVGSLTNLGSRLADKGDYSEALNVAKRAQEEWSNTNGIKH